MKRLIFVAIVVFAVPAAYAQTKAVPSLEDNVSFVLNKIGLSDKIQLAGYTSDGNDVVGRFASEEDRKFFLDSLKRSKDFTESDGIWLMISHHGAEKSFRQLSSPSLHVIWYKNQALIHFDMNCPGYTHPVSSYRHFREVAVHHLHHSQTSQRRVAEKLQRISEKEDDKNKLEEKQKEVTIPTAP